MKKHLKLLIGYDGSPCSDAALNDLRRAGLPECVDAVIVTVAHVFLPPEGKLLESDVVSPGAAAMVARLHAGAEEAVRHAFAVAQEGANRVRAVFPNWTVTVKAEGDSPSWALIKMAARMNSDLIVVGSHGHSSTGRRLIMGSVSLRVLYEANCSVRVGRCSKDLREGPVRIVIGFNGSKDSDAAVDAVASRSWPEGSEVRLVTAREGSRSGEHHGPVEKLRVAGLATSEVKREGDPAHVLVKEAADWNGDSIFVGTRDLHGFRHLLQGSVSSAIAAHAPCSVEVVRAARVAGHEITS